MLNTKIQDGFNKQINEELFSSYLYLSMAAHFESQSLTGMAHWMRLQAQEELGHALKFFDFINDRDGRVVLAAVAAPKTEWDSILNAFEESLAHEQKITGLINGLVDLALSEKDHAANTFLEWFVTEQVEEEAAVRTVVDKLKLAGDSGVATFMIDGELGTRVAAAPDAAQQ